VHVVAYACALLAVSVQEHRDNFREFLTATALAVLAVSGAFAVAQQAYGAVSLMLHGAGQVVLQTHQVLTNLSLTHIDYLKTVLHALRQSQAVLRHQPVRDNFYNIVVLTALCQQSKPQHSQDVQQSLPPPPQA
jgi:hypothetical protein